MEKEDGEIQENTTIFEKRTCLQGKKNAPLFSWPWENMGNYKYLLYGPLVAKFLYSVYAEEAENGSWCFYILIFSALRGVVHQLWCSIGNLLFLNRKRRIFQQGIDFNQIDKEWHWDNFLILQAMLASLAYLRFPFLSNLPIWDIRGCICCIALHMAVSEPLYYWLHRWLHSPYLFQQYHWLYHSSEVPHAYTAGHATFLEHLILCVIVGIPSLGTAFIGYGSISTMFSYVVVFDFLRCLGDSNVEVFPHGIFRTIPILKHFIRTPTYQSLHHVDMSTNFCLFMPIFDTLWKTTNKHSWTLHKEMCSETNARVPEFVFLAHVVDIMSALHSPFVFRSFSSGPFSVRIFLFPLWILTFPVMFIMWAVSKTFLYSFYNLRGRLHQTWVVPRFGFQVIASTYRTLGVGVDFVRKENNQYFLPFAADGINSLIEEAILRADRLGVKVISLAALNKNEGLNGGGTLFVNKHPNLKVRVVHGNTMTAGVILNALPRDVDEVFITGATSKLGRAIALYLARRKIRVLMLTLSTERFLKIQKEAPPDSQNFLVQVTKYQAAKHCKTWIIGKWTTPREQSWAPPGTHFHQFVVPPIIPFRRDCTYGKLAAMRLPEDVEGLGSCEYSLERGIVHACHAGGVVHILEGWTHHEVGAINVDQIDIVWKAALKHGLKPV